MAANVKLPPGFVLDENPNNPPEAGTLPPGFVLDTPAPVNFERPVSVRFQAPNQGALPGLQNTEANIAARPSQFQGLADLLQNPEAIIKNPGMTGPIPQIILQALGAAAKTAEQPLANVGLQLQEGNTPSLQDVSGGITGSRPGEFGDIYRNAGVPGPLSALGGLLAATPLVPGLPAAEGAVAAKGGEAFGAATKGVKTFLSQEARVGRWGRKLKLPENVIKGVQKYGVEPLMKFTRSLGDTVKEAADSLSQRVQAGFDAKLGEAEAAFKEAMSNVPIGYKDKIDVGPVRNKLIQVLRRYGKLAASDQQGSKLQKLLDSLNEMTSASTKRDLTLGQRKQIYITGKSKAALSKEVLINKSQFSKFRDVLNNLYRESSGDRDVFSLVDSLYTSGEKAGLTGLSKARALFRQVKQAEAAFPKSLYSEAKLQKAASTLSEAELRKLSALEKYLKISFVEDAKKVSLSKHAQAIADAMKGREDLIKKAAIGLAVEESTAGLGKKLLRKAVRV